MRLALFDLDNTLLGGDSDYEWGQFLVEQGVVDGDFYERENQRFYDDYVAGTLDIYAFVRFAFRPLAENDLADLLRWREAFFESRIKPLIQAKAQALVEHHRQQGHTLMIVTATNRFVTEPIANAFGVERLLATEPEFKDGRYTGELADTPCFKEGKVERLGNWLRQQGSSCKESWCYSDSHNDIPLLEFADHPTAVDADDQLLAHARHMGWPVISLRNGEAAHRR